ncbi:MAG: GGDEF domain-containing protein [Deltaproteobacteria bacterium]|nr:GGDEF domain-containing protein [Deltaproteobacteria bacterium]
MEQGFVVMDEDKTVIHHIRDIYQQKKKENAYLVVIAGRGVGRMFKLTGKEVVIGRHQSCDIILEDDGVSRRHAKLLNIRTGDTVVIDLKSTNGTFANGVRIQEHTLKDGDKIQIGKTTILKFSYQDDIEEKFQKELYNSVVRDGLTGTYNKKFFMDRIGSEFSFYLRHGQPLSLIMFDIDHFKKVNDTWGHQAGDFVLKKLVDVVNQCIRGEDIFARYGGEEFTLLLRDTDAEKAYILADRIRKTVAAHRFVFKRQRIPVTISLGIATLREANLADSDEMIAVSDEYLYKAKHLGRNRVESDLTGDDADN